MSVYQAYLSVLQATKLGKVSLKVCVWITNAAGVSHSVTFSTPNEQEFTPAGTTAKSGEFDKVFLNGKIVDFPLVMN